MDAQADAAAAAPDGDGGDEAAAPPEPAETARLDVTLRAHGKPLRALPARARAWLAPRLDTADGTAEVLERVHAHVETPAFLERLVAAAAADSAAAGAPDDAACDPPPCDVTRLSWWTWRRGDSAAEAEALLAQAPPPDDAEPEPLDAYVLVEREDVIEALAFFIARFVASHPEASALRPEQLQRALCGALAHVRRGRARRLWDWGRAVHRWGVWAYGAASLYENPWLLKALGLAFYTAGRVAVGLLF